VDADSLFWFEKSKSKRVETKAKSERECGRRGRSDVFCFDASWNDVNKSAVSIGRELLMEFAAIDRSLFVFALRLETIANI
jgi:hypothetical protein